MIFYKNHIKSTLNKGIITIYHDYERHYHNVNVGSYSDNGLSKILDTEKKFKIKSTFNIVSRLINDLSPVISKIKDLGHDIASHSYSHSIMTKLSTDQLKRDIELSKSIFTKNGLELTGLRSPQSKWNFKMLPVMSKCGLKWSAENDRADYPYIIHKNRCGELWRMPIKMDDWEYEENRISPNQMFKNLIQCAERIEKNKIYGAIGFHPWVQGKQDERTKVFYDFIEYVSKNQKIVLMTFNQAFDFFKKMHN